jgi:hypothetical protein
MFPEGHLQIFPAIIVTVSEVGKLSLGRFLRHARIKADMAIARL